MSFPPNFPSLAENQLAPNFRFPISNYSTSTAFPSTLAAVPTSMVGLLTGMFVPSNESEEDKRKRWSSFIGIIVAISGNILISLALNIQKYAHVRLRRERLRTRAALQRRRKRQAWKRILFPNGAVNASSGAEGEQEGEDDDLVENLLDGAGNFVGEESVETEDSHNQAEQFRVSLPMDDPLTGVLTSTPKNTQSSGTVYLQSPWWWMGLFLMTIGECGNFLAYGFAPASIVSPLGVVAMISNCIIAPVMLKEPFRSRDFMGVIVSIAGVVIVVLSSAPEEVKLGPDAILRAISQTAFEVYFGVTCAMIIVLSYLSPKYGTKFIFIDLGLVGLYGGYTVLSTKGISSLLSSSLYRIFTMPVAYLCGFVLVATAVAQIKYVNRALQRFDSTQVIPTQFVLFTLSVITGSAILYRDFEKVDRDKLTKFFIGCTLTFCGVYLITSGRPQHEEDEDEHGIEEGDIGLVEGEHNTVLSEGSSFATHSTRRATLGSDVAHTPKKIRRRSSLSLISPSRGSSLPSSLHQRPYDHDELSEASPLLEHDESSSASLATHAFIPNHFGLDRDRDRDRSHSEALARHSISLIPSPFMVSNQLLAVVADQMGSSSVSASPSKDGNKWNSKRVTRRESKSDRSLRDHKPTLSAAGSIRGESSHSGAIKLPSSASSVKSEQSSLAWSEIDDGIAAWRQNNGGEEGDGGGDEGERVRKNCNKHGEMKGRVRRGSLRLLIDGLKEESRKRRKSTGDGDNERQGINEEA